MSTSALRGSCVAPSLISTRPRFPRFPTDSLPAARPQPPPEPADPLVQRIPLHPAEQQGMLPLKLFDRASLLPQVARELVSDQQRVHRIQLAQAALDRGALGE